MLSAGLGLLCNFWSWCGCRISIHRYRRPKLLLLALSLAACLDMGIQELVAGASSSLPCSWNLGACTGQLSAGPPPSCPVIEVGYLH